MTLSVSFHAPFKAYAAVLGSSFGEASYIRLEDLEGKCSVVLHFASDSDGQLSRAIANLINDKDAETRKVRLEAALRMEPEEFYQRVLYIIQGRLSISDPVQSFIRGILKRDKETIDHVHRVIEREKERGQPAPLPKPET